MEQEFFEKLAARIPRTRVQINKSRWMGRYAISAYLSYIALGSAAFFFLGSLKVFYPYNHHPKQKIYRAYPDYVNGTISFYEKEVDNVIHNL